MNRAFISLCNSMDKNNKNKIQKVTSLGPGFDTISYFKTHPGCLVTFFPQITSWVHRLSRNAGEGGNG
jgi:hypothetical protein